MKVLVISQSKSGTTALYYSILEQLEGASGLFEPPEFGVDLAARGDVVVKVLVDKVREDQRAQLATFDRRVFIVRDPRDALVSRLTYVIWDMDLVWDDEKVTEIVAAFEEKERRPETRSVVDLYRLLSELSGTDILGAVERLNQKAVRLWSELGPAFFLVRYEDLVSGNTRGLREFLGLNVSSEVEVPRQHKRVSRTKAAGGWRHWFLEEDVAYFKPKLEELMAAFGYEDDWRTAVDRRIEPEHCSLYVTRLVTQRRQRPRRA